MAAQEKPCILVIANPAAGNGTGTATGRSAVAELESLIAAGKAGAFFSGAEIDAAFLSSAEQTADLVESSRLARCIVAVGGDGLVHLVVNALMKVPAAERPALAVVPAGTGNDYARALQEPLDMRKAVRQILMAEPRPVDLGLCNGEYFAETLSFGVDAAIALETVERRVRTGRSDAGVYFSSGIDQLRHNRVPRAYHGLLDGEPVEGESLTFAVQVGPYYGGGFRICPDAQLDDGLLDVCISRPPLGLVRAMYTFVRAKNGNHVGMKSIEFTRIRAATIEFDEEPPCQIDGEPLIARRFEISCVPSALRVLA